MLFLPMLQLGPEYPGEHLHLLFTQIPPFRQSGWQVAEIGKKKEKNNKMNAMGIILEENTESWTKQRKEITAETKAQITWRRNKFPTFA